MLFKRKRENEKKDVGLKKLVENGDVKVNSTNSHSKISDTEFAKDFEECCNVEVGRETYPYEHYERFRLRNDNFEDIHYKDNRK